VDTNGEPPVLDISGWEFKTIDLSPWLDNGEDTFTIWFEAGDTGDTAMRTRTGVYVDAVRITGKPEPCEGDFDTDGNVDGSDLAIFAADFGRTDCGTGEECEGDFDDDGEVEWSDLALFAADFGRTDCACTPDTCSGLGFECGLHDDGCGGMLYCGECAPGFTCEGGYCVDIDECADYPCGEHGTCMNGLGYYSCYCDSGYEFDGNTCVELQ